MPFLRLIRVIWSNKWLNSGLRDPADLTPKAAFTHCVGGWVGPTAGLDILERVFEPRFFQLISESLYRLSYSELGEQY